MALFSSNSKKQKDSLIVYCIDKKTKLINFKIFNVTYNDYLYYKKKFGNSSTSVIYRK